MRRLMFRTISQIGIKYPHSPLSGGRAGGVASGQRLPWAAGRYEVLRPVGWHLLHVGPGPAARAWAAAHSVAATEIAPAAAETPGTVYFVRPDGYVGLVAAAFDEMEFTAYARHWLGQ